MNEERIIVTLVGAVLLSILLWVGITTEGGSDHYKPQKQITVVTKQGEDK